MTETDPTTPLGKPGEVAEDELPADDFADDATELEPHETKAPGA